MKSNIVRLENLERITRDRTKLIGGFITPSPSGLYTVSYSVMRTDNRCKRYERSFRSLKEAEAFVDHKRSEYVNGKEATFILEGKLEE